VIFARLLMPLSMLMPLQLCCVEASVHSSNFRDHFIRPVLRYLDPEIPYSPTAEMLVAGTIWHESNGLTWVRQRLSGGRDGRARGIGQMEPATYDWLREWVSTPARAALKLKLDKLDLGADLPGIDIPADRLHANLPLSVAYTRLRYWAVKDPLPPPVPLELARYWKAHYNTPAGAGTPDQWVRAFEQYAAH
jgi:hypothetical protein